MSSWPSEPDDDPGSEPDGGDEALPAVLAGTDAPIPIDVRAIEDERVPEGMVCLGTFIDDRLVARCVVPPHVSEMFEEQQLFAEPVRLVLAAREAPPGLQCQLFALVELPADEDEDEEPWAGSVPSSGYERAVEAASDGDEDADGPDQPIAAIPLGQIVRFARDRRHPDNLALEAMDVLGKVVAGRVVEVVDKALEDLLGD
ncbi:MAG TPA: hypothetical protein VNK43_01090 [Gemmatimonadales bacterium]|nr:hypothetical protein [Gemmatimonadales bacterium]